MTQESYMGLNLPEYIEVVRKNGLKNVNRKEFYTLHSLPVKVLFYGWSIIALLENAASVKKLRYCMQVLNI